MNEPTITVEKLCGPLDRVTRPLLFLVEDKCRDFQVENQYRCFSGAALRALYLVAQHRHKKFAYVRRNLPFLFEIFREHVPIVAFFRGLKDAVAKVVDRAGALLLKRLYVGFNFIGTGRYSRFFPMAG